MFFSGLEHLRYSALPLPSSYSFYFTLHPSSYLPHQFERIFLVQVFSLPSSEDSPGARFHLRDVSYARYDMEMDMRDNLSCLRSCE